MNKTLKFRPELAALVLEGKKTSTWRLFDDKDLSLGDVVDFLNKETLEKFMSAKLIEVFEKPLGSLSDDEKFGHEKYSTDEEMFKTLEGYYQKPVDGQTIVKVVRFEKISE